MPRRRGVIRREAPVDPKYNNRLVGKLINVVMRAGKKSVSEGICYGAFDRIRDKTGQDPIKIFKQALDNVKPALEVKSRRVGGASYQVPVDVRPARRTALGLRWIVSYAHARAEKSMREKLAAGLMDASNNTGAAVKKREDTHRMAEANKAFSHYRW
ncbi:MAG: 30S ribosomal protein S7 [Nitrospirae bacterium]|nr:30S ribosomal protein S7 [Nitrospirota bacterium]